MRMALIIFGFLIITARAAEFHLLDPAGFSSHIDRFNTMEDENVTNFVSNAQSWDWLQKNIPLLRMSRPRGRGDLLFPLVELSQASRADAQRLRHHGVSHAGQPRRRLSTPSVAPPGFIWPRAAGCATSVISTTTPASGCAATNGKPQPHFHKFSSWFAAAAYDRYLVNGDKKFSRTCSPISSPTTAPGKQERQLTNGLFWQYDVRDGMEESISGSRTNKNIRPTINSYMFANARAIAAIARLAGKPKLAAEFDAKAAELKRLTQEQLWDDQAQVLRRCAAKTASFSDCPRGHRLHPVDVRPAGCGQRLRSGLGATDRSAGLLRARPASPPPSAGIRNSAPTASAPANGTARSGLSPPRRRFMRWRMCCAATQPITHQASASRTDFDAFLTYVHSQHADGKPYIGEYLDEVTGDWINGKNGRSRYYNHSTYADLLITGVVGLRPRADDIVEMHPLLPAGHLGLVLPRRREISWPHAHDRLGQGRFALRRGAGLRVLANGKEVAHSAGLARIAGKLP